MFIATNCLNNLAPLGAKHMDVGEPAKRGGGIKSRTPAGLPGWGPRPGVKRSGTPGSFKKKRKAHEVGDSF